MNWAVNILKNALPKEKAAAGAVAAGVGTATTLEDLPEIVQAAPVDFSSDNTPDYALANQARTAFSEGYSAKEVEQFLTTQGLDGYRTYWTMRNALQDQVREAQAGGWTDDELFEYFDSEGLGYLAPTIPPEKAKAYRDQLQLMDEVPTLDGSPADDSPIWYHPDVIGAGISDSTLSNIKGNPEELVRAANVLRFRLATDTVGRYILPNNEAVRQVRQEANSQAYDALIKAGFSDVKIGEWGDISVIDPETGEWTAYENPWYIGLAQGIQDNIGQVVAGTAASILAPQVLRAMGPYARGPQALGTLAMVSAATSLGAGYDVLNAASKLNTELKAKELAIAMGDVAVTDTLLILGISGLAALGPAGLKAVSTAYDRLLQGNKQGAFEAAKQFTNLNDAQVNDLLAKWEKTTGQRVRSESAILGGPLLQADKDVALSVMAQTTPGMDSALSAALRISRGGGAPLAKQVSDRAKAISAEADSLTNDNVTTFVKEGLNSYTHQVENYKSLVREAGITQADAVRYRFNFNDIQSVKKFLQRTEDSIVDYGSSRLLARDLDNLRKLGMSEAAEKAPKSAKQVVGKDVLIDPTVLEAKNPKRTFGDLLDLRDTVVRLGSEPSYLKVASNKKVLDETLAAIDKEIAKASRQMEGGRAWHASWKQSLVEEAKMKELQKNALYKALTKDTVSVESAVKAFSDALHYDGAKTYMAVMETLPPSTRKSVEGAVVRNYVEKATVSLSDDVKAIDFPKLSQQLSDLTLTQPEARDIKRIVTEMADLYKNDADLVQIAWNSPAATPRNNIATTVLGKLKMQLATSAFQTWQALSPFDSAKNIALTLKLRKVINNPLDANAVTNLKSTLGKDPELETMLHKYSIEYAKFGKAKDYDRAPIYQVAKVGDLNKASNTSLGKGVLAYTDKSQANRIAKTTGQKVTEQDVPIKAIARPSDVSAILGREMTEDDLKNPAVINQLKQNFLGYTQEDKVLLFK